MAEISGVPHQYDKKRRTGPSYENFFPRTPDDPRGLPYRGAGCDPDDREARDEVAAPILEDQGEPGQDKHPDRDIVAEAILAGEKVEKLPLVPAAAGLTFFGAVLARLPEDLLVRDRPGDARDGNREDEKRDDLN